MLSSSQPQSLMSGNFGIFDPINSNQPPPPVYQTYAKIPPAAVITTTNVPTITSSNVNVISPSRKKRKKNSGKVRQLGIDDSSTIVIPEKNYKMMKVSFIVISVILLIAVITIVGIIVLNANNQVPTTANPAQLPQQAMLAQQSAIHGFTAVGDASGFTTNAQCLSQAISYGHCTLDPTNTYPVCTPEYSGTFCELPIMISPTTNLPFQIVGTVTAGGQYIGQYWLPSSAISGTVAVVQNSVNITFSQSQTIPAGTVIVFADYPYDDYTLQSNVSGTSGTLTSEFTGNSNPTDTVSVIGNWEYLSWPLSDSTPFNGPPSAAVTLFENTPSAQSILYNNETQGFYILNDAGTTPNPTGQNAIVFASVNQFTDGFMMIVPSMSSLRMYSSTGPAPSPVYPLPAFLGYELITGQNTDGITNELATELANGISSSGNVIVCAYQATETVNSQFSIFNPNQENLTLVTIYGSVTTAAWLSLNMNNNFLQTTITATLLQ